LSSLKEERRRRLQGKPRGAGGVLCILVHIFYFFVLCLLPVWHKAACLCTPARLKNAVGVVCGSSTVYRDVRVLTGWRKVIAQEPYYAKRQGGNKEEEITKPARDAGMIFLQWLTFMQNTMLLPKN
jgi:hypothetical protein